MAIFERNGRSIGYSVHGEGQAILSFHGTTQSGNAWDQVRDSAEELRTWVSFEFPGSGESSFPTSPLDLEELVEDAVALMAHLGHDSFHIVGYSLGAVVALHTASQAPNKVLSVTSLCGWSQSDARMRLTFDLWRRLISIGPDLFMRYALVDGYTPQTLEMLEPMADAVATMGATTVQPGSDAQLELDIRIDIEESLPQIICPALIIGAKNDRWVDVSKSRHIASRIKNSRLIELEAGHLVIGELAADIAKLIVGHTKESR